MPCYLRFEITAFSCLRSVSWWGVGCRGRPGRHFAATAHRTPLSPANTTENRLSKALQTSAAHQNRIGSADNPRTTVAEASAVVRQPLDQVRAGRHAAVRPAKANLASDLPQRRAPLAPANTTKKQIKTSTYDLAAADFLFPRKSGGNYVRILSNE